MDNLAHGLSIVIPVYNSAESLPLLAGRLKPALETLGRPFEVILVNDGSGDRSWDVVQRLADEHPWVVGIDLMRNYGQHNALLCGIRAARFETIVTMDDDLQHPPEEIARLIAELERGADVVYGKPEGEQHGWWRNFSSQVTKVTMERMFGIANARDISAFRAFRTRLRDGFAGLHSPFVSIDVVLTWSTTKSTAVQVRHDPRTIGKSNYSTWKLVVWTISVITAFSTVPLRVATLLGFLMAVFGTGVLAYVVGRYLLHGSVPGFPFLACIVSILSGAQLVALGIIGEYLGRMFLRSIGRPMYAIKDVARSPATISAEIH